jgi:hypothetical protein
VTIAVPELTHGRGLLQILFAGAATADWVSAQRESTILKDQSQLSTLFFRMSDLTGYLSMCYSLIIRFSKSPSVQRANGRLL